MAKQLDPVIAEILKKHGFGADACWNTHGAWVVYHRVLEQIAAKAGITFSQPHVIEADSANGVAVVCVTGDLDGRTIWSIGEAAPGNYRTKENQPSYPWAMAEKRAIDRVILKLIGLHGLAYSEEEADDFKITQPVGKPLPSGSYGKMQAKGAMQKLAELIHDPEATDSAEMLKAHLDDNLALLEQVGRDWPEWLHGIPGNNDFVGFNQRVEDRLAELQEREAIRA